MKRIKKPEPALDAQRPEFPWKHRNVPDYDGLIQVENLDQADQWRWEWTGPGEPLRPVVG
jgi:hypothetical protein